MTALQSFSSRYANVIAVSKRVRWEIERDVVRGWQYIVSGAMEPRFRKTLFGLLDEAQANRIEDALAPLLYATPLRAPGRQPLPLGVAA